MTSPILCTVTELTLRIRDGTGSVRAEAIHTADLATWTAGEARTFLHAVIRALGAHGVYRTAITMSAQMMWTVNVEADTSVATSAPMALATDAAIKLEKLAFRLPDSRGLH